MSAQAARRVLSVIAPRRHGSITPQQLAEWETCAFSALRRHRDLAASTPIDDALPGDALDMLGSNAGRDELRQLLRSL